jgi:PAS domain S-box-containing protein
MKSQTSKYKSIFEVSPIPIWEEDFSEVKKVLIKKSLVGKAEDFILQYLADHPGFVSECIDLLLVKDFNYACVDLHHAKSKEELFTSFHTVFTQEAILAFKKQILSICRGIHSFQTVSKVVTLDGQSKTVSLAWKIVPGFEENMKSVIVTTTDISSQQNTFPGQRPINKWAKEFHPMKHDGSNSLLKGKMLLRRAEYGNTNGNLGTLLDISEQKKNEDALSKERNLLRTLIDNIPDYIYVKDYDSKHLVNNLANVELLGAKNEAETIGKTAFDYFPENLAKAYIDDDRKVLESKEPLINREEIVIDKAGSKKWLSTSKIPILDHEGSAVGLLGISKDITLRKNREQSLIKKTRLLETIAEVVKLLLSNDDHESILPECLELMGKAVDADRVYFYENFRNENTQKIFARQVLEWTNGKVAPQINNPSNLALDLDEHPLFLKQIASNQPYNKLTRDIEGTRRKMLLDQDIKSVLQNPIFVGKNLFGFVGFDDCTEERVWSKEEVSFLSTLSFNLGSAIERKQNLDKLKALNEKLQKSNTELAVSNKELEQFAYVASHDLQEPPSDDFGIFGIDRKKIPSPAG